MSDIESRTAQVYLIGSHELRLATRELLQQGAAVELQPKVFDFIAYLVLHRDRAVDKSELLDAVWPRQIVTETALTRCVMKARRAFGDDAEAQRVIRTVHSRGYRFVADVLEVSGAEADQHGVVPSAGEVHLEMPSNASSRTDPGAPRGAVGTAATHAVDQAARQRSFRTPLLGVLLICLIAGIWWMQYSGREDVGSNETPRVALLPISNDTGQERYDWIRLGMQGAVHDFLQESGIGVVPPSEVLRLLRGRGLDAEEGPLEAERAARELRSALGATHTVSAVLRSDGGGMRLDYRVIDRSGQMRRRTMVGKEPTRLASALATDLAAALNVRQRSEGLAANDFAIESYVRARALSLAGDFEAAVPLLDLAIAEAPTAFWPRYELAVVLRQQRDYERAEPLLRTLVAEAHAQENAIAEEHALNSLAIVRRLREDTDEAEQLYARALDSARSRGDLPSIGKILQNQAILAQVRREFPLARERLLEALSVFSAAGFEHPPPYLFLSLGHQAETEGDFATAENYLARAESGFRALGVAAGVATVLFNQADLAFQTGRLEEAARTANASRQAFEALGNPRGVVASMSQEVEIALLLGRTDEAEALAQEAVAAADALSDDLPQSLPRAYTRRALGEVLVAQQRLPEAEATLQEALVFYTDAADDVARLESRVLLAELMLTQGRLETAQDMAQQAAHEAEALQQPRPWVEARALLARVALVAGDTVEARRIWSEVLQRFQQELPGEAHRLARARLRAVPAWLAGGDREEAQRLLDLAHPVLGQSQAWQQQAAALQP